MRRARRRSLPSTAARRLTAVRRDARRSVSLADLVDRVSGLNPPGVPAVAAPRAAFDAARPSPASADGGRRTSCATAATPIALRAARARRGPTRQRRPGVMVDVAAAAPLSRRLAAAGSRSLGGQLCADMRPIAHGASATSLGSFIARRAASHRGGRRGRARARHWRWMAQLTISTRLVAPSLAVLGEVTVVDVPRRLPRAGRDAVRRSRRSLDA